MLQPGMFYEDVSSYRFGFNGMMRDYDVKVLVSFFDNHSTILELDSGYWFYVFNSNLLLFTVCFYVAISFPS